MSDIPHSDLWLAEAVRYVYGFKFSVFPIGDDKRPLIAWKIYQERRPTFEELLTWPRENLAIVTGEISNLVVADCESKEDAVWFAANRAKSQTVVKTKRGFHFYFQHSGEKVANAQRVENRYDVRGDGGYVLAPPSRHADGAYTWFRPLYDPKALPAWEAAWRPPVKSYDSGKDIADVVAYISKIKAVQGQGGNADTYRAAATLREAGFSQCEALLALQSWNKTNAEPMWSDKELVHKIHGAFGCEKVEVC